MSRVGFGRGSFSVSTTIEAVDGAHFRAEAERVGFQRQQAAAARDDLVFVFVVGARARHEDFPIAVAAHAHGMAAAVPEIEIADHADALRIGRPHREADASDAVERDDMGTELFVQPQVVALAQQVQIVVGEQGREAIGVFQLHLAVVELRAQAIALRSVDGAGEQPGRVDALQFALAVLADRDHAARVGQEHAHHGFVVLGVRTEIGEGIGVAAGDDVACGWRKRAHEAVSTPFGADHPAPLEDAQGRLDRDMRPARPVAQFVFDLVKRLFQQEQVEQIARLFFLGRPQTGFTEGLAIALPIDLGQALAPGADAQRKHRVLLRTEIGRAGERRAGGVVDRAQEAGDIARGRLLAAALIERAARLALEVEDIGVVLGDQHLAEMEIAVMADLHAVETRAASLLDMRKDRIAVLEQALGQGRGGLAQAPQVRVRAARTRCPPA